MRPDVGELLANSAAALAALTLMYSLASWRFARKDDGHDRPPTMD